MAGCAMASSSFWRLAGAIALGGAGAIALWQLLVKLYPTLVVLAAGLLIAYLLDPALDRLERRGWSRARAVWSVSLLVALVAMIAAAALVPLLVGQLQTAASNWPDYVAGAQRLFDTAWQAISGYLQERFPDLSLMPYLDLKVTDAGTWAANRMPGVLLWISDRLARSLSLLGLVLLVALVAFHFMMIIDPVRRQIGEMLSADGRAEADRVDRQISVMLGQYLRGLAVACLLVAILTGGLLQVTGAILGSEYGLLIGALAGVGYAIPWVGPGVSACAAAFLGYVTADHHAALAALLGLAIVLVVNQASDTLLMPSIVGRRVGLHPLAVIFALLAGYALAGIPGMIVATPTAAALKIVLCRWLPVLEEPEEAPPRRKRLTVDVGALVEQVRDLLGPITRRIQDTFTQPPQPDPDQPPGAPPESAQQDAERGGADR
jgi:predicted PurR-regulated permease PerM